MGTVRSLFEQPTIDIEIPSLFIPALRVKAAALYEQTYCLGSGRVFTFLFTSPVLICHLKRRKRAIHFGWIITLRKWRFAGLLQTYLLSSGMRDGAPNLLWSTSICLPSTPW